MHGTLNRRQLDAKLLREILDYDPTTGVFTWRAGKWKKAGTLAGRVSRGYRYIGLGKKSHAAHRLAWLYVYGEWPARDLDHVDLDPGNNRISNLRLATVGQNGANSRPRSHNRSGFKGVSWHGAAKKWRASVTYQNRNIYLGVFENPEDAHAAYLAKARELFGEFARG